MSSSRYLKSLYCSGGADGIPVAADHDRGLRAHTYGRWELAKHWAALVCSHNEMLVLQVCKDALHNCLVLIDII